MREVLDWSKPYHRFFEEMTRIPHGSCNEKQYSGYLAAFARERNLACRQYDIGNVIIYKDASPGYEDHPAVVLQSHIDMVCEKVPDCGHDFERDPLDIYVEKGWLRARGTTLGADDGTGVAYMLSILADQEAEHPPLECVFTVQEEVGLNGAFALEPEDLKGRRYISLDDGGGGAVTTITSAGGMRWQGTFSIHRKPCAEKGYRLVIGGLQGGHSGECIGQERGNAVKICGRILNALEREGALTLSSMEGGSKDNAIPRDCQAEFVSAMDYETIGRIVQSAASSIGEEYRYSDPGLTVSAVEAEVEGCWDHDESRRFLDFLLICPNGMRRRSMNLAGLTTASENLAVVRTAKDQAAVTISLRGAGESYLDEMAEELRILSGIYGIDAKESSRYSAWGYEENSYMREVMREAVKSSMGKELELLAVHGGLECGVFKSKWPDMDMVTLGPVGLDVHSPDERLDLQSFDRCYELLKEFLRRL